MNPLSAIQRYIAIGMAVTIALVGAWGLRIDQLRGHYRGQLDRVVVELKDAGFKSVIVAHIPADVSMLAAQRDDYRTGRQAARDEVARQSASILDLKRKSDEEAAESAKNRKLAEAMAQQRDVWIARARAASTRTERLSDQQEVKECETVLDALYQQGF